LPEPKTLSANQCRRDVEEEREALSDLPRALIQGGNKMKDVCVCEREREREREGEEERERKSE